MIGLSVDKSTTAAAATTDVGATDTATSDPAVTTDAPTSTDTSSTEVVSSTESAIVAHYSTIQNVSLLRVPEAHSLIHSL